MLDLRLVFISRRSYFYGSRGVAQEVYTDEKTLGNQLSHFICDCHRYSKK